MQDLYYSALDIAIILSSMQLGCRDESKVLDSIWQYEKAFLEAPYETNQRKFILDTYYWIQYLYDKPIIDKEFPAIQKDLAHSNKALQTEQLTSDFSDLDLFFKSLRIRILYGKGKFYARIKLKTLLKQYGYKRRSQLLLQHINRCMEFYHLETTSRGGVPCSIADADLDQMLTFWVTK